MNFPPFTMTGGTLSPLLRVTVYFLKNKPKTTPGNSHGKHATLHVQLSVTMCRTDLWKHLTTRVRPRGLVLSPALVALLDCLFVRSGGAHLQSEQLSPSSHGPPVGDPCRKRPGGSSISHLSTLRASPASLLRWYKGSEWWCCATSVGVSALSACCREADTRGIFPDTVHHCFSDRVSCVQKFTSVPHGGSCSCATGCSASAMTALGESRNRCAAQTIDRINARRCYKCRRKANATPDGDLQRRLCYIGNSW